LGRFRTTNWYQSYGFQPWQLFGDLVFVEKFGFCKVINVLAQQELDVIFRIQVC
jgi:hypothetical protein